MEEGNFSSLVHRWDRTIFTFLSASRFDESSDGPLDGGNCTIFLALRTFQWMITTLHLHLRVAQRAWRPTPCRNASITFNNFNACSGWLGCLQATRLQRSFDFFKVLCRSVKSPINGSRVPEMNKTCAGAAWNSLLPTCFLILKDSKKPRFTSFIDISHWNFRQGARVSAESSRSFSSPRQELSRNTFWAQKPLCQCKVRRCVGCSSGYPNLRTQIGWLLDQSLLIFDSPI